MAGPTDRIKLALERFVGHVVARLPFYGAYRCTVVAQDADGTLQLQPDDAILPGLTGVPIRGGLPGVVATLDLSRPAYCFVAFEGGNPGRPYVLAWEAGTLASLAVAGGTAGAVRVGDGVNATADFQTWLGGVATALASPLPPTVLAGAIGTAHAGSSVVKVG